MPFRARFRSRLPGRCRPPPRRPAAPSHGGAPACQKMGNTGQGMVSRGHGLPIILRTNGAAVDEARAAKAPAPSGPRLILLTQ